MLYKVQTSRSLQMLTYNVCKRIKADMMYTYNGKGSFRVSGSCTTFVTTTAKNICLVCHLQNRRSIYIEMFRKWDFPLTRTRSRPHSLEWSGWLRGDEVGMASGTRLREGDHKVASQSTSVINMNRIKSRIKSRSDEFVCLWVGWITEVVIKYCELVSMRQSLMLLFPTTSYGNVLC